ncbi:MAG TPA: hypothetical protein VJJ70_07115 [Anaerolineales bacterium]|nr:hypothetical protein [Anaerolineales bacterium]
MATIEELKRELDECYVRMTFAAGRAMAGLTSTMVDQVKLTAGSAHQAHEKAREEAMQAFKEWDATLQDYIRAKGN